MGAKIIFTEKAPQPIGPYSQAIAANGFLFVSGQIALNPHTGSLVTGTVQDQTKRVLENIKAILAEAGISFSQVVKTTLFLKDLKSFDEVNQVYSEYFSENKPARSTVEVSRLPKGADIEIEVTAVFPG
jgi:2-iminobutanoate/2-iminopropanoate deaminase